MAFFKLSAWKMFCYRSHIWNLYGLCELSMWKRKTPKIVLVAFMNCVVYFLQISCFWKYLITGIIFVIFWSSMNSVDMCFQMFLFRKHFITRITFVIFVAVMNSVDVCLLLYLIVFLLGVFCCANYILSLGEIYFQVFFILRSHFQKYLIFYCHCRGTTTATEVV